MLNPGSILQNRYQIIRQLGAGGMGAVYLAHDLHLQNRQVVVKENLVGDPQLFYAEANILAALHHLNLPRVGDHFVEANSAQYLVMDYIAGQTLEQVVQTRGRLTEHDTLAWIFQILDAVKYLHTSRIIHRDIKPQNIIITPGGKAVLVDFGIAKVMGQGTQTGARGFGSPGYASPAHYTGGTDERSDVYALGATLYFALTGAEPPSVPERAGGKPLLSIHQQNPASSRNIENAVFKAMALLSSQRYQSVPELEQALHATVPSTVPVARHNSSSWVSIAVVGMCILCAGAVGVAAILAHLQVPAVPTAGALVVPTDTVTTRSFPISPTVLVAVSPLPANPTGQPTLILIPLVTIVPSPTIPPTIVPTTSFVTAQTVSKPNWIPTTQPCPTPVYFQSTWRTHSQLGCPGNAWTSDFTFQKFEKGWMLWRKIPDVSTIYILLGDNKRWESQPFPAGGPTTPPCPESAQYGSMAPIRGFGTVWCNSWRTQIGRPLIAEQGVANNPVQEFTNGMMLSIGGAGSFILYSNHTWEPW